MLSRFGKYVYLIHMEIYRCLKMKHAFKWRNNLVYLSKIPFLDQDDGVYSTANMQLSPLPAVYHSDLWVITGGGWSSQPLLTRASD